MRAGVYRIEDPASPVSIMCDRAVIALRTVKGSYFDRVALYDPGMREALVLEREVVAGIESALREDRIELFLQPKCNIRTGKIVGAEALARWRHPERGIVAPGEFIPLIERNGLVRSLDLRVWEKTAAWIRGLIDEGVQPVPVSVNVSRADIYLVDVAAELHALVERYGIDPSLIEVEITESAYSERPDRIVAAFDELAERGFTVLMDDFGSGYSSLNMLKDITVDVLKIDMGFLNREDDTQRSESILEAVVSMARLMDLRIIAEGAETKEQVDFLQGIGCDYAQGYYFYRPMSTEALEQLLSQDGIVDYRGVLNPSMELIDVNALLHDDMVSRAAVNNLIGGLAVYAVYADRFELLQVNNEYYHVTGCNSIDLRERQNRISRQVHPDDLPLVQSMFAEAYERPVTGAEATFRRYRLNGEIMWMRMRAFFLRREQDRTIFFASLADVTEQKQQEDELRESQAVLELEDEVLHRIIQQSDLNVWVYDIASDRLSFQNLSSNGIASLLAASADEEDTASLGDDVSNVLRRLSRETLWGRPASRTIKVWSNTGEPLTLHIEREIVPDANGKPARVIGYLEDPLNDSRAKLTRSDDNRLLDILKGAAVDHWYINVNTKSFLNSADRRAWRYWAGISLDDWSSSMLEDRLGKYIGPSQDAEAIENFLDFDDMLQRFADGERNDSLEYRLGENDDERWMELSYRMVQLEEDGYVYAYLSVTDIDERKRRELDLEDKAEHDALTGLLNRQSASVRMANALERTLQRGYRGAFAIIDLDDFKQVNDRYGHLSGDTVLADVAQHLCGAFRKGDLICRWGGDEFVVYCEDMERDDIERRLVELSEGPWNATLPDNRVIELSVSTGIAMVPQDGIAFKTVYERADRALYRAKSKGKAHFCFFEADKDS